MMWFVCVSSYSLTIPAPSVAIATAIPIVYLWRLLSASSILCR